MGASPIVTERLILIPMTLSMVNALLRNSKTDFVPLGISFHKDWPRQDTLDILSFLKDVMATTEEASGFDIWMVIRKDGMLVIGDAGFKGAPDEHGHIEIGFGLVEDAQRQGYGYETAQALINWASRREEVKVVMADCLLNNSGSVKVLKKCGMREFRRDDAYIYWEKQVKAHDPCM